MKIRPVILCGGAGTRLWIQSKNNTAKQFIDFGGWSLLEKTFERIKSPAFDFPVISTNAKYIKLVKNYLKKSKIKKYKIILEPSKRNTAPAKPALRGSFKVSALFITTCMTLGNSQ